MPYLTILLVAVSKIFLCVIWYRLRARGNRIEYTLELFLIRVLYDIGESIFLVIFAFNGYIKWDEVGFQVLIFCFLLEIIVYFICVRRALKKLKEINDLMNNSILLNSSKLKD